MTLPSSYGIGGRVVRGTVPGLRRGAIEFVKPSPKPGEWPVCARCGKLVDRFVATEDPLTGDLVFMAFCHGSKHTERIPHAVLLAQDGVFSFGGKAFDKSR